MAAVARWSGPVGRAGAPDLGGVLCALTGGRLLDAWDRGAGQEDLDRAVTLLAAAKPGATREQVARLGLPVRNRELLRLRLLTFGPRLAGFVPCGSCGARLELSASVPAMLERLHRLDPGESIEWTLGGFTYALRAVNTDDLREANLEPDERSARRRLLERCLSATGAGDAAAALGAAGADPLVVERFDRLHQGAEIACEVRCPECATADRVDLDIARFLWDEVRHAALRLLRDVHDLASAYGWPEAKILGMSSRRRHAYLAMVRA